MSHEGTSVQSPTGAESDQPRRLLLAALGAAGAATVGSTAALAQSALPPAAPGEESTYERVLRTKTVRVGLRPGDLPNFAKDLATRQWVGACIDLMNTMATDLGGLRVEWVEEAAAANNIVSLQTGRIDLTFGLAPTPQRALAVDFTNSLFDHPYGIIARPGFNAASWADLDKPGVKLAVNIGTSEEAAAKAFAPKAVLSGFRTRDEVLMALSSGRVDGGVFAALLGLVAVKRNPAAGSFRMISSPRIALPSAIGVPKERDARWRELINACLAYYRGIGRIDLWFVDAMARQGIQREDIPDGIF